MMKCEWCEKREAQEVKDHLKIDGTFSFLCHRCYSASNSNEYHQPERSKRENVDNELDKFKPKSLKPEDGYFPPPWNPNEFPEKTLGWLEFQRAMKEDPDYYL